MHTLVCACAPWCAPWPTLWACPCPCKSDACSSTKHKCRNVPGPVPTQNFGAAACLSLSQSGREVLMHAGMRGQVTPKYTLLSQLRVRACQTHHHSVVERSLACCTCRWPVRHGAMVHDLRRNLLDLQAGALCCSAHALRPNHHRWQGGFCPTLAALFSPLRRLRVGQVQGMRSDTHGMRIAGWSVCTCAAA